MYKKSIRRRFRLRPVWPFICYVGVFVSLWPWLILTSSGQEIREQGIIQQVDSFGEPISVFKSTTTVSPNEETATKVSVETFNTILGALDSAAFGLEGISLSTSDTTTPR